MHIGLTELVVIIIVALACIKPDKLIEYSSKLGRTVRSIIDEQKNFNDSVEIVTQPIQEIKNEVRDVISDVHKTMKGDE